MRTAFERLLREHALEKATLYLVIGIITSVSHNFHDYKVVIFLGHMLIASAIVILISMLFNNREAHRVNLMHRVVGVLDIFSGAVFITTFAAEIFVFIIDEIKYYHDSKILSESLFNHLFITILIVVLIWLLILSLPTILQAFKRNKSFRERIPSILIIVFSLLFIFLSYLKKFPLQTILQTVLIVSSIFTLAILFSFRKHSTIKLKSSTSRLITAIYLSHVSLVLIPVFILAGVLAWSTEAIQPFWFWIAGAVCFCICVACILKLSKWREELFGLVLRCVHALILIVNFTKSRFIAIRNFLISLFITIFHLLRTSLAIVQNYFITLTLHLRRLVHEIQTRFRRRR